MPVTNYPKSLSFFGEGSLMTQYLTDSKHQHVKDFIHIMLLCVAPNERLWLLH